MDCQVGYGMLTFVDFMNIFSKIFYQKICTLGRGILGKPYPVYGNFTTGWVYMHIAYT